MDRKADEFTVVMGNTNLYLREDHMLQYSVLEFLRHSEFATEPLIENDVALLFMNGYVPWTHATVKAIDMNLIGTPANTQCLVSGWGRMIKVESFFIKVELFFDILLQILATIVGHSSGCHSAHFILHILLNSLWHQYTHINDLRRHNATGWC